MAEIKKNWAQLTWVVFVVFMLGGTYRTISELQAKTANIAAAQVKINENGTQAGQKLELKLQHSDALMQRVESSLNEIRSEVKSQGGKLGSINSRMVSLESEIRNMMRRKEAP